VCFVTDVAPYVLPCGHILCGNDLAALGLHAEKQGSLPGRTKQFLRQFSRLLPTLAHHCLSITMLCFAFGDPGAPAQALYRLTHILTSHEEPSAEPCFYTTESSNHTCQSDWECTGARTCSFFGFCVGGAGECGSPHHTTKGAWRRWTLQASEPSSYSKSESNSAGLPTSVPTLQHLHQLSTSRFVEATSTGGTGRKAWLSSLSMPFCLGRIGSLAVQLRVDSDGYARLRFFGPEGHLLRVQVVYAGHTYTQARLYRVFPTGFTPESWMEWQVEKVEDFEEGGGGEQGHEQERLRRETQAVFRTEEEVEGNGAGTKGEAASASFGAKAFSPFDAKMGSSDGMLVFPADDALLEYAQASAEGAGRGDSGHRCDKDSEFESGGHGDHGSGDVAVKSTTLECSLVLRLLEFQYVPTFYSLDGGTAQWHSPSSAVTALRSVLGFGSTQPQWLSFGQFRRGASLTAPFDISGFGQFFFRLYPAGSDHAPTNRCSVLLSGPPGLELAFLLRVQEHFLGTVDAPLHCHDTGVGCWVTDAGRAFVQRHAAPEENAVSVSTSVTILMVRVPPLLLQSKNETRTVAWQWSSSFVAR